MVARLTVIAAVAVALLAGAAPARAGNWRQRLRPKITRQRGHRVDAPRPGGTMLSGGPTPIGFQRTPAGPTSPPKGTAAARRNEALANSRLSDSRRPGRLGRLKRAAVVGGLAITLWAVLSTSNPVSSAVHDLFHGGSQPVPTQVTPTPQPPSPPDPPDPHWRLPPGY